MESVQHTGVRKGSIIERVGGGTHLEPLLSTLRCAQYNLSRLTSSFLFAPDGSQMTSFPKKIRL